MSVIPLNFAPSWSKESADWRWAGLLALLVSVLLLLLPASFLQGYDYAAMHGFYREYLRNALHAGEFPWWNPYTALGRPFFADIETGCTYPPTYLIVPLGVTGGVVAGIILHCWLALWATKRLATAFGAQGCWAWLGALTFLLCGPVLSRLQSGQLTVFASQCWVPAVLLAGVRLQDAPSSRGLAWLGLTEALCFLAGSPNTFWIGNCGLACLLGLRGSSAFGLLRLMAWLGGAALLAAALVSFQALPFLELVQQGNRPVQDALYATRHGMAASTWLSLILPASGIFPFAPEFNQYVGAVLLVLGASQVAGNLHDRQARALLGLALVGLILAIGDRAGVLGWLANHLPGFGAMRYPSRYGFLTALAVMLAGAGALTRLDHRRPGGPARWLGGLHLSLLVAAAVSAAALYRVPTRGYWDTALQADLRAHGLYPASGTPPRVAFDRAKVRADSGLVEGYSTLDGFANPMLRNVWTAVHREAGLPTPGFDLHELSAAVYDKGPFPAASAALVAGWDPRTSATVFRSSAQAPPRVQVAAPDGQVVPDSTAVIESFTRNSILVRISTPTAGELILAEPAYPGWRAIVNGRAADVGEANGWMRRVAVPPGISLVRLWYRPRHLLLGLGFSLAGVVVTGALLGRRQLA